MRLRFVLSLARQDEELCVREEEEVEEVRGRDQLND